MTDAAVTGAQRIERVFGIAIGVPLDDVGSIDDAGSVYVFRGTSTVPVPWKKLLINGGQSNWGSPAQGDRFGTALVTADFNNDGISDLVVSAVGINGFRGATTIFKGRSRNDNQPALTLSERYQLDVDAFPAEQFQPLGGFDLAVGHVNSDEYIDLAISAFRARPASGRPSAGAVVVRKGASLGTAVGLTVAEYQFGDTVDEEGDDFGKSIAFGDLDGDGRDDLVVGAPGDRVGNGTRAGSTFVFRGTDAGPVPWFRLTPDMAGLPSVDGLAFGASVDAGDLNGDGLADVIVGAPGAPSAGEPESGDVAIFASAGSETPVFERNVRTLMTAQPRLGERLGANAAVIDIDGDGDKDLVVGAPGFPITGERTGRVRLFRQVNNDLAFLARLDPPFASQGARFGEGGMVAADFNADGVFDFAAGAPGAPAPSGTPAEFLESGMVFVKLGLPVNQPSVELGDVRLHQEFRWLPIMDNR